jgi:3-phenylpropionate/trans-cinnamate dioxygenase beta subunit
LAILRDNKRYLEMRVTRLDTGMAWAEDPPSRTRHLIGFVFFSLTLACARETKKTQPK